MLVTNKSSSDMPAELVGALYRQRWRIELFYRWIHCLMGADIGWRAPRDGL